MSAESSVMPRSPASRLVVAACLATSVVAVASCGSRTGLWGSDIEGSLPDASRLEGSVRDAPEEGAVKCTPGRFTFELATAQLMFVIDRSGSMAFSLDGRQPDTDGNLPPGILSRWDTLRDALFSTITPFDNALAMGAKFYPEESPPGPAPADEACRTDVGVGIPPARGNSASIIDVFDTTRPNGGTPTSEAIRLAAQYIQGTRSVARTMVVATDGAPNCNGALDRTRCTCTSVTGNCQGGGPQGGGEFNCLDDTRTIGVVRDIFQTMKIPVYVIGIGSTERPAFLKVLDDMAVAGGRPRPTAPFHYNVQTSAEMKAALGSISEGVAKCTYLTPSAPTDPNAISVEIDGKPIARDPSHTNGWDWVDQAFGTLAFFGAACTSASAGTATTSQITGVVRCD
jgi:hypothetical protein